jgi:hypothetical protein
MSEGRLTNAWVWLPSPPPSATNPWQAECYSGNSHYVVNAPTQRAAQEVLLHEHPELRAVVRWLFEIPPQPKRPGEKPDAAAPAIEGDVISYHAIAKRLHPDLCGKRKFTADQVMQIINELRASAAHK